MQVEALGWSGFVVESMGVRVVFDPHWSVWRDKCQSPPWDLHAPHVILASHGHDDHFQDVPTLLRSHPNAAFAGAPELVAELKRRLPADHGGRTVVPLPADRWSGVGPIAATRIPGTHVGGVTLVENGLRFFRYLRRRPFWACDLLAHHLLDPSFGGVQSLLVRFPSGESVVHACECVHRHMDVPTFCEAIHNRLGGPPDLLLIGVEPGDEAWCAAAVARLGSKRSVVFTPHAPTRRWFRLNGEHDEVDRSEACGTGAQWMGAPWEERPTGTDGSCGC